MSLCFSRLNHLSGPLGPPHDMLPTVPGDAILKIVRPPFTSAHIPEPPIRHFARLDYRPASMQEFWQAVRERRLQRHGVGFPIACLGSVWRRADDDSLWVPYLFDPADPLNLGKWRLRRNDREYGPHWRFAAYQRPLGYDFDPGD